MGKMKKLFQAKHNCLNYFIRTLAVFMAAFHVYIGLFGGIDAYQQRALHLGLGLPLIFLLYPAGKNKSLSFKIICDYLPCLVSTICIAYIFIFYDWITIERFFLITPLTVSELILGMMLIVLIIEATRRVVGKALCILVLLFLFYPLFGNYFPGMLHTIPFSWQKIIDMQYLTTGGIFGIPLGVSASVIVLFIVFASFVQSSGFADFVYEFSAAIMKKARGGPAKIAVIASALVGSICGSSTANVVTTGSFTIPMMKKIGLKPEFAGAVEASASTVGLILPPVMSGAAFLMAAFTGLPYKNVCIIALLPALINVYAVYLMVHFETIKYNLQAVSVDVSLAETFKRYYHILIPPLILVILIIKGYSPGFVCSWSIIAFVVFCFLRKHTRLSIKQILDTLESGAKGALLVLVATAASGIIVGSVDLTGLGHRLASGLVELTGGNISLTLIIAMVLTLILGTGMPPAATYVVLVAILVPALINLSIPVYAAHFFVVFFAGQSLITPPMAITSYAAATIAGADPMKTSWLAIKISLTAFIIPFMFVVNPAFLMIGSVGEIISVTITALMGVFLLAISLEGYFLQKLNIYERILAFIGAILLIYPEFILILPGGIILCILVIPQAIRSRKLRGTMDNKGEIRLAD